MSLPLSAERYLRIDAYLHKRMSRAPRGNKAFYRRLLEANDRKLKSSLKRECEAFADTLIETSKRLNRRKEE